MRPSVPQLVQVIRRKTLPAKVQQNIMPAPVLQTQELKKPNLIDLLMQQKVASRSDWPANIRLEPVVKKVAYHWVQADVRVRLKRLLNER